MGFLPSNRTTAIDRIRLDTTKLTGFRDHGKILETSRAWTGIVATLTIIMFLINISAFLWIRSIWSITTFLGVLPLSMLACLITVYGWDKYQIHILRRHCFALLYIILGILSAIFYELFVNETLISINSVSAYSIIFSLGVITILSLVYVFPIRIQIRRLISLDTELDILNNSNFPRLLSSNIAYRNSYPPDYLDSDNLDPHEQKKLIQKMLMWADRNAIREQEYHKYSLIEDLSVLPLLLIPFLIMIITFLMSIKA